MALVNVLDVNVLDNPTSFTNPFQFEITFECLKHLPSGTISRAFVFLYFYKLTYYPTQISSGKLCT